MCNFSIENLSEHVYRTAEILKSEENILQGEQFNLQPSNDKLYDEMHYEWSKTYSNKIKVEKLC